VPQVSLALLIMSCVKHERMFLFMQDYYKEGNGGAASLCRASAIFHEFELHPWLLAC